MNKGILVYAHNSPDLDYGLMSIISAGLAKKNLNLPVTLISDKWTLDWIKQCPEWSLAKNIFDNIVEVEKPRTTNSRNLHDGFYSKKIPFNNTNRPDAYELSPYDKTLLIDSDFLIFTDNLNEYWTVDQPVMMSHRLNDLGGGRESILDRRVSETGVHLYWATTVMFDKSPESKFFFQLVDFIKSNYRYYADLFRFNPSQYRNDISFSIAKHVMNGFDNNEIYALPPVLSAFDKDVLFDVTGKKLKFFIDDPDNTGSFWATTTEDLDIHVMNKQSIIRNKDRLLELI
jgi:hypothetical protein